MTRAIAPPRRVDALGSGSGSATITIALSMAVFELISCLTLSVTSLVLCQIDGLLLLGQTFISNISDGLLRVTDQGFDLLARLTGCDVLGSVSVNALVSIL